MAWPGYSGLLKRLEALRAELSAQDVDRLRAGLGETPPDTVRMHILANAQLVRDTALATARQRETLLRRIEIAPGSLSHQDMALIVRYWAIAYLARTAALLEYLQRYDLQQWGPAPKQDQRVMALLVDLDEDMAWLWPLPEPDPWAPEEGDAEED